MSETSKRTPFKVVALSRLELWVIRAAGACILTILGWIGVQFQEALIHVAEIRKELDITSPADVKHELQVLEKKTLSIEDVESAIYKASPWLAERQEWEDWRRLVEISLDRKTRDRIFRSEILDWIKELKKHNPNITIPELSPEGG